MDRFESTRLAAAAWYDDGQHGGAVSALIARAVEQSPSLTPMEVARVTVELFRVLPVTELEVVTSVVREGKKIQTSEVRIYSADLELARGLVQRLRFTDLGEDFPPIEPPSALPDESGEHFGDVMMFTDDGQVSFGRNAVQVSHVEGSFAEVGTKTVWFRVTVPLVVGEIMSPTQRAVITGDFANGLTRLAQPQEFVFMNSDLTVRLARQPLGDWIGVRGSAIWDRGGRGLAEITLFDGTGAFATAGQTLFLDRATN